MYHELIKKQIEENIPRVYFEFNGSNPVTFPFAVYTVRVSRGLDDGNYRGDLEIEIVDNKGNNKAPMETMAFDLLNNLDGKLFSNDRYFINAYSKPGGVLTIPSIDDQINRKLLQFTLNIDRRYV